MLLSKKNLCEDAEREWEGLCRKEKKDEGWGVTDSIPHLVHLQWY